MTAAVFTMPGRCAAAALMLAAALSGCASWFGPGTDSVVPTDVTSDAGAGATPGVAQAPPGDTIEAFSSLSDLAKSRHWSAWRVHVTKPVTRYRLVDASGTRVLQADADKSASGLAHRLDVDPGARPILVWRWRVDGLIEGADVGDRHADDAPVRIVLAFDGDTSTLPLSEQMFFERVKLLAGHDMPYATLMYVWDNRHPVESVVKNSHTSRIRKLVVASGPRGVKQWNDYRRDIVADYRKAFGESPGRLIGVSVFTDTDNTKQRARAQYGDIRLVGRPISEPVAADAR